MKPIKREHSERSAAHSSKSSPLGAEKLTAEEQRRRFIEAAREAGASEDEAEFDKAVKRIVEARVESSS